MKLADKHVPTVILVRKEELKETNQRAVIPVWSSGQSQLTKAKGGKNQE